MRNQKTALRLGRNLLNTLSKVLYKIVLYSTTVVNQRISISSFDIVESCTLVTLDSKAGIPYTEIKIGSFHATGGS
ncbi:MAG TPA: hypothetical protein DDW65_23200 [Firmicutes bacterium]|nr:hypothetical protein [Bacillota bacterium]